jgi:PEGA domain-containing protein
MNQAAARTPTSPPMVFRDAFGERRRIAAPTGSETLDVLCLRSELTAVPSFEFALRERVSRLAGFRHPHFAQVRTVERLGDPARTLALISNSTPGARLCDLLANAARGGVVLDTGAALCLVRQLVTAMATLHEQAPDASHGALGPERIIVSPSARLVVVEHVLGSAVEQLQYSEDRYWRELRVPCPSGMGPAVFDQRTDVFQIGIVTLALLSRQLLPSEELQHLQEAVASVGAISPVGETGTLPSGFRPWLRATLQLDPHTFRSAVDARDELEQVFALNDNIGEAAALEAFLARCELASAANVPAPTSVVSITAATVEPDPSRESVESPSIPVQGVLPSPAPLLRSEPAAMQPFALEPIALELPRPNRPAEPAITSRVEALSLPSGHAGPVKDASKAMALPSPQRKPGKKRAALAAMMLLFVVGGGSLAARMFFSAAPSTGTVAVTTNPAGVEVLLDGQSQGVSPTTLTVTPGAHVLELRGSGEPRSIPIEVTAGAQLSQYIEMGKSPSTLGNLVVRTEPAGGRISVDGVPIGPSPVTVVDLQPGEHTVVVDTEAGTTKQTVIVEAGATASLVAQLPIAAPAGPTSGWISVNAPRTVQLFEDGRLIGSSDTERLMVPTGTHRLEIVNEALGFRDNRTVQVVAGRVAQINLEFPKGTIALNALPWADVWIDGEKVGETPIGNLTVTIGSHEIIFRHPELGEQRHVATVTLNGPARLSVDLRKK